MHDDDNEISAMWRERREAQQAKRASNREASTAMLRERGIHFTEHNMGAHLVVMDRWDFWPGTGKFMERKGRAGHPKRTGRGVRRLLQLIEGDAA